jgi:23S rRNA (cytosine1962-C5)-methyltransferase
LPEGQLHHRRKKMFKTIESRIPKTDECVRLFHGRGKKWPGFEHLSIDLYPPNILITTYKEITEEEKISLVTNLSSIPNLKFDSIVLQKRYGKGETVEVLAGELSGESFAVENSEKYLINLKNAKNIGFFLDMAIGRDFVRKHSQDKKVLNLFSYTCSLSVAALKGGAAQVVNVDMSKAALGVGESNHTLNGVDKRSAKFLSHDIMKSFGALARKGPYDLIIIDPPTNQGDSFKATRDYHKIVRRLHTMTAKDGLIMACLNSPHESSDFLMNAFQEHGAQFTFREKMFSSFSEMEVDPEEGLKILIFQKTN